VINLVHLNIAVMVKFEWLMRENNDTTICNKLKAKSAD